MAMDEQKQIFAYIDSLTNEHQNCLMLCRKIRSGLKKNIELNRIKAYANWNYENLVLPHLEKEEQLLISVLGMNHSLVTKSMTQHRRLKRLFSKETELIKQLNAIEEELESNIRFEEHQIYRELRNHIHVINNNYVISKSNENKIHLENWNDEFWNEINHD